MASFPEDKRRMSNAQVAAYRYMFPRKMIAAKEIAARHGIGLNSVYPMLRGHTYKDVPDLAPGQVDASPHIQAQRARRAKANGVSVRLIAKRMGVGYQRIYELLNHF